VFRVPAEVKADPVRRWSLPDRAFFACGACQVLAYAFLEREAARAQPRPCGALWIRPRAGFTGNHIVIAGADWVFDYHGYSDRLAFLAHTWAKAARWYPGWDADLVALPQAVLVSEKMSRTYAGLWLREPGQFLHNALPRARAFLARCPP
jgi:hypothetical protein